MTRRWGDDPAPEIRGAAVVALVFLPVGLILFLLILGGLRWVR